MIANPFQSAAETMVEAQRQWAEFNRRVSEYVDQPGLVIGYEERHVDTGAGSYKLRITRPVPPKVATAASVVLTMYRSALDHAAYACADQSKVKWEKTAFPIANEEKDLSGEVRARLKCVPDGVRDTILSFEPFRPTAGRGNFPLWVLNVVRNKGLHRLLLPVLPGLLQSQLSGWSIENASFVGGGWNPHSREMELVRLYGPHSKVTPGETNLELDVAFGDALPELLGFLPEEVFVSIDHEVRRVIIALEAERRASLNASWAPLSFTH